MKSLKQMQEEHRDDAPPQLYKPTREEIALLLRDDEIEWEEIDKKEQKLAAGPSQLIEPPVAEPMDLETDLSTALELLGRVQDMFHHIDRGSMEAMLGEFHYNTMLGIDRDITDFLNDFGDAE